MRLQIIKKTDPDYEEKLKNPVVIYECGDDPDDDTCKCGGSSCIYCNPDEYLF